MNTCVSKRQHIEIDITKEEKIGWGGTFSPNF